MELKVGLPTTNSSDFFYYRSAPSSPRRPLLSTTTTSTAEDDDFEFDFSGQLLHRPTLSAADELFDAGVIRPLEPLPRLQVHPPSPASSGCPKSPTSKNRSKDFDPFEIALERTRRSDFSRPGRPKDRDPRPVSGRGISRSLSPLRVSEFALQQQLQQQSNNSINGSSNSSSSSSRGSRKWRLKDFLLFRSISEGRATTKRYSACSTLFGSGGDGESKRIHGEDERKWSFRSGVNGAGEGSNGSLSRRRSAHELHYTANRAVSEEMKKKTSLPYKYGLLGCLGLNPSSSSSSHVDDRWLSAWKPEKF